MTAGRFGHFMLALLVCCMAVLPGGPARADGTDYLILVSREHRLRYEDVPAALTRPDVSAAPGKDEAIFLVPAAAEALENLFAAALADGVTLYAVSGYRSYSQQRSIYERKVALRGEERASRTVARAGASEHQTGLAMDINGESTLACGLSQDFGASPEGQWIGENAHRFGFILRYPKGMQDITGYAWEPWHIRFVGEDASGEIYRAGLTLETYLETR